MTREGAPARASRMALTRLRQAGTAMSYVLQSELESYFLKYVATAPFEKIVPLALASGRVGPLVAQITARLLRLQHAHLAETEHRDGVVAELTAFLQDLVEQFDVMRAGAPSAGIATLEDAFGPAAKAPVTLRSDVLQRFQLTAELFVLTLSGGGTVDDAELGALVRDAEQEIVPPFDLIHRQLFRVLRDMAVFEKSRAAREVAVLQRQHEEARATLDAVADAVGAGIAVLDGAGQLVHANDHFGTLHALTAVPEPTAWESILARFAERGPEEATLVARLRAGEPAQGDDLWIHAAPLPDGGQVTVWRHGVSEGNEVDREEKVAIEKMALTDGLTGLPNRTAFLRRLDEAVAGTPSSGMVSALLLLDLDHFKKVNDTYGHPVGDELLKLTSARLLEIVGEDGCVTRLGGDEFAILLHLEEARSAQVFTVAQRIVQSLGEPFEIRSYRVRTGSSVGITIHPHDPGGRDELLQNADIALYKAKHAGRGMVALFDMTMRQKQRDRQQLEDDLQHAIDEEQFIVHYQPQISLVTGEIIGVEALIRWHHPKRGELEPASFIAIAEASGQIVPITNWLIAQALDDVGRWSEAGHFCGGVSVNISPVHFAHSDLFATIRDVLDRSRIDPRSLELEITETTIIAERSDPGMVLEGLKELGVRIAIDDFGVGYSSFSRLKQLPIDRLKVDQSFVADVTADARDRAIAGAIVELGHSLGMSVIAEGIETAGQAATMLALGCTEMQGYFFSRPLGFDGVSKLLASHEPQGVLRMIQQKAA